MRRLAASSVPGSSKSQGPLQIPGVGEGKEEIMLYIFYLTYVRVKTKVC